ncbi:MAG: bifunctional phosphoribosylaminoimidazolecarboxamide formyltransferase/IMP cyclohydrolase, partial [Sandaracinaceae bacterium]|nr:bifunctional phosphoribosylaminoimidazolecarboxamide formyltransferase/IMP cyclohydrolase [Sandaracinaceae bacterium]
MSPFSCALISVYDKTNILPLAQELKRWGVEILSTGGTAAMLREAGISVVEVSEYTGFPELMGGRVKTLHPKLHAGILMRGEGDDRVQLEAIGGKPIDLVVVNLYPFESALARKASLPEAIELI